MTLPRLLLNLLWILTGGIWMAAGWWLALWPIGTEIVPIGFTRRVTTAGG